MNYIVMDLEWNQPIKESEKLSDMPFEILEIGAVKLNEKLNIVSSFDHYVKPCAYKEIHPIIRELISVNKERLRNGESFKEVFEKFIEWCGEDYIFCTWGSLDLNELQRNVYHYGIDFKFPKPFIFLDIQKLYSIDKEDGELRRNLEYAIEDLGITVKKDFHNALNDAHYTALVCQKINFLDVTKWYSIDTYNIPKKRNEEIYARFETYEKYISMGYKSKETLLRDRRLFSNKCYVCGETLRRKISWTSNSNRAYLFLGKCKEHGYVKGRMRVKKADNGNYFAIRIMKVTDDAGALAIYEKTGAKKSK